MTAPAKPPPKPIPCRECGESIVFLPTSTGKTMPVDERSIEPGDDVFDPKVHVSHFATCTNAARFRRPR